jgi:hypothetical protein
LGLKRKRIQQQRGNKCHTHNSEEVYEKSEEHYNVSDAVDSLQVEAARFDAMGSGSQTRIVLQNKYFMEEDANEKTTTTKHIH